MGKHKLIGRMVWYRDLHQEETRVSTVVASDEFENLAGGKKVFLELENGDVIDDQSCWFAPVTA